MDKKRKWQLVLILAVVGLTIYNILPTLFFYAQPLKSPVSLEQAESIAQDITKRVDEMESESVDWLTSYCKLLNVEPTSIQSKDTGVIALQFSKAKDAELVRKHLPRAGALISFFPAQLRVIPNTDRPKEVIVQRQVTTKATSDLFTFVPKESDGYKNLIQERMTSIVTSLTPALNAANPDEFLALAGTINDLSKIQKVRPELGSRLAAYFSRSFEASKLRDTFAELRDTFKKERSEKELSSEDIAQLEKKELKLASAEAFIKKHPGLFIPSAIPEAKFEDILDLSKNHPFFDELEINWSKNQAELRLHPDVVSLLEGISDEKQLVQRLLIDEAAKIAKATGEKLVKSNGGYSIPLQELSGATGVLTLKLDAVAKKAAADVLETIRRDWRPEHPDLMGLAIVSSDEYASLSSQEKNLCLVVSAPISDATSFNASFQNQSIYVVAKGLHHIFGAYAELENPALAQTLQSDFRDLATLLGQRGFGLYQGSRELANDYVFEQRNFFGALLSATREDFKVFGSKKTAWLELSDLEQRLLTQNKIENKQHEDFLKWNDEYRTAVVNINPSVRFDVPAPTKSIFWNNVNLTMRKLIRGDERKVLRWGLDLSGGKSVQIELRDQNNKVVKEEADIKQGINELFDRVNKMGVSDVSIRQIGNHIALDFPGSQALTASELIKSSSMSFHIVNEKFGPQNRSLASTVDRFLQEVWNEALVTGRKDAESIQAISLEQLHGETPSEAARNLLENGLVLSAESTQGFNESTSQVSMYKGENWEGQEHPLLIVFRNSALEGADLENIRSSYDPSKGNFLSFEVKRTAQDSLFTWTSKFSKDKISGTQYEKYSRGNGWRMAVVLNDVVINAPTLQMAIRDQASISGNFTQREVNQLAADLKAGSLTFTPHILFEKNISPELGKSDRMKGIGATAAALVLVIVSMIAYYRFAGLVASIAVLFNLLILWATLQNLGATLSLAGIAGIILTVGMAVDANVLVFERIKEEMSASGRIGTAIQSGYEKAFSAIVDSNITTIIAALILLNFDAGPIKAFAVCMIIGIVSSMFTALFMTRFYFNGWLKNPKHTKLSMANWIRPTNFDFLKKARLAFAVAAVVIVGGGTLLYTQRSTLFGMDFTGGYAVPIELAGNLSEAPAADVSAALVKAGASPQDFQVRQHHPLNNVQILFGTSMEQQGKPFFGLPIERAVQGSHFSYEKNPRIHWAVNALNASDIQIAPATLASLDSNWTAISGQMSSSMRNNALLGLLAACVAIFIYIAFRFEYKYAIAAVLCLLHDVFITLGLVGILHVLKVPVQIDLNTIAALMTIIGYSLNDTIIIFDRIREDVQTSKNMPMRAVVNRAINTTLSRTSITSGTTLLVVLALLLFGGSSIFSFSLVMVIGIVFGTISSWFIACPFLIFFHQKEEEKEQLVQV
jgi:SecD/SecF fusion protein